jgi:hypothetical protein
MNRLFFGVILFSILVFVSCQKEIDWGLGASNNPNLLLVKIKSKTGTDTTQVDYSYDASKRLIREKTTGVSGGTSLDNDLVIKRNASGIITTTVQKSAILLAAGVDSIETRYNYSTTTSKYTSSVFQFTIAGTTITDSTVYNYNGSGRITGDDHYLQVSGLPIPLPPLLGLKNYYIYSVSGTNIDSVKQDAATIPGGPLSPASVQAYKYDSKINPLIILNEALLLARTGLYNVNNTTRTVVTNAIDPTQDFTMDYTYKYNIVNKPDSSAGTRTPGGTVTTTKYFYQ